MQRRSALAFLASIFAVVFGPSVVAAATAVPVLTCDDCGREWREGECFASYARVDGTWGALCDFGDGRTREQSCFGKRCEAELLAWRCSTCGCGIDDMVDASRIGLDGSHGSSSGGRSLCGRCDHAETLAMFARASCVDCGAKPVVVFEDGTPYCAEHRRWGSTISRAVAPRWATG